VTFKNDLAAIYFIVKMRLGELDDLKISICFDHFGPAWRIDISVFAWSVLTELIARLCLHVGLSVRSRV